MFEALKNDAAGLAILREWLGDDGVPVPLADAERRSHICVAVCREHRPIKWWENVKHQVAKAIKKHLALKHRVGLMVSNEESLGMCKVCGCCTRLKVHVPLEHIRRHTNAKTLSKFPLHCWIVTEAHK